MLVLGAFIGCVLEANVRSRLTTPSSATPGRERGCEHGGARRRRGLCRASWRAAQPVTEPVGPQPRSGTERPSPEVAAAPGYAAPVWVERIHPVGPNGGWETG